MTDAGNTSSTTSGDQHTDKHHLATLDVTRSQHDQRLLPLLPGQTVAVGVRRIHVLPTPLSSYVVYGKTDAQVESLQTHPFLVELASRMKTRITTQLEPRLGTRNGLLPSMSPLAGVAVIHTGSHAAADVSWLLRHGASEVLLLPESSVQPRRVLIHWTDEAVRHATLAVSASMLRHVAAEATYLNIMPTRNETQKAEGMRELLDARSSAQTTHGLEMRTELHFGDVARELSRQLHGNNEQMLILGITDRHDIQEHFASIFKHNCPVLVVFREQHHAG